MERIRKKRRKNHDTISIKVLKAKKLNNKHNKMGKRMFDRTKMLTLSREIRKKGKKRKRIFTKLTTQRILPSKKIAAI